MFYCPVFSMTFHRIAVVAALLVVSVATSSSRPLKRIVAVADVHGDRRNLMQALE